MLKRITANEARDFMPNRYRVSRFEHYMYSIYTQIERRAKQGYNCCVVDSLYYPSKMKAVIDTLREDGYVIEYHCLQVILACFKANIKINSISFITYCYVIIYYSMIQILHFDYLI